MSMSGAISLLLPALAQGHAYIYYPPMRGGAFGNPDNSYCPQCLGSVDLPMPTCGNDAFLNVASGPVTTFTAGQRVEFDIKVTAHHKGHFQFRLCDQTMSSAVGDLADQEDCLNGHVLERVRPEEIHSDCQPDDSRGDCQPFDGANPSYWYLPPKVNGSMTADYTFTYKLPDGVTCEKCTLQWWWSSANSCTPHPDAYQCYFQNMQALGWNAAAWCNGACSFSGTCPASQGASVLCGEQFKNCADVQITASGSGGTSQTTEQGTAAPTPAPAPEPESEPETEAPTAAPTRSPTLAPTQAPTHAPSSPSRRRSSSTPATCTVNTALIMNRGVSQADCDKCPTGYKYWPCNELGPDGDILCFCSGSLLEASASKREVREHRFLGLIQRSDEVQRAAWTGEAQALEFDREEL